MTTLLTIQLVVPDGDVGDVAALFAARGDLFGMTSEEFPPFYTDDRRLTVLHDGFFRESFLRFCVISLGRHHELLSCSPMLLWQMESITVRDLQIRRLNLDGKSVFIPNVLKVTPEAIDKAVAELLAETPQTDWQRLAELFRLWQAHLEQKLELLHSAT